MLFRDREDAGRHLAQRVAGEDLDAPLVLALPRGGVPVAAQVASALGAPLMVFVARKVAAPGQPEFGIGAIAEGSDEVLMTSAAHDNDVEPDQMRALADSERVEVDHRVDRYRHGRPLPPLSRRDVLLVDDGLATGVTAEVALRALRRLGPRRLVLAVPVCAADSAQRLAEIADSVICVASPESFGAVGTWYKNFTQVTDDEVLALLDETASRPVRDGADHPERTTTVDIPGVGPLHADLTVPTPAAGVVLFAHGSGSSRRSPRNRHVARALQQRGLGTVLTDLLTENEERLDTQNGHLRFDIDKLASRLRTITEWLAQEPSTIGRPIGYFGASTGAAAALVSAAQLTDQIAAVVSRGGRPDLAGPAALRQVSAPTLLIVGGKDNIVLKLNHQALGELGGHRHLEVVEGATHLFEEPGALEEVSRLAGDWFTTHMRD